MKTSVLLLLLAFSALSAPAKILYENNFEKAEPGKLPESEFLVLDGEFAVKEEAGNKFLELPGAPLDTFGIVFGPTQTNGVAVSARIFGTGKGRRFPTFAVGLNGATGLKLQVSPSKKSIELYSGEEVIANVPYTWESGTWTMLKLQLIQSADGKEHAQGKVWKHQDKEPQAWQIDQVIAGNLSAGRASIWGNPYSGTPIRYDDLQVATAGSGS
jgi:hypothetical protein